MVQKVAELLDEKCKVLETFSEVKQKVRKAVICSKHKIYIYTCINALS